MKQTLKRTALTLIELLVVLMILAILSTVAVQSLAPVVEQGRFEATQKTLTNIRFAIVGAENVANSRDSISGFVADMGRLPNSLDELLIAPADAATFGLQTAPTPYIDVLVPRGWRGPYVRLPVGSAELGMNQLQDGWGLPFVASNPTPLTFSVTSPAAQRSSSNTAYNTDLNLTIQPSDWQATLISGMLSRGTGSPTTDVWSVALFSPGPATVDAGVHQQAATIITAANGDVSYSIATGLTIGPRVLRAMKNGVGFGNPVYMTVRAGATHVVNFQSE